MLSRRNFLDGASLLVGNLALGTMTRAGEGGEDTAMRARKFVAAHEEKVRPLERASSLAWWVANISGKDEDFAAKEEAQNRLDAVLADRGRFEELKAIRSGEVDDPTLARQVEVLFLQYQEKQVDPALLRRITAKANAIEKAFNAYRAGWAAGRRPTARSARCSRARRTRPDARRSGRRPRGSARSSGRTWSSW